jgi:hypothetical protein
MRLAGRSASDRIRDHKVASAAERYHRIPRSSGRFGRTK